MPGSYRQITRCSNVIRENPFGPHYLLALGLTDVVQSYAGGIKLDTLFFDEGFGSLDTESLDLAIRTLIDLQSSGRMVGIISYVSELKRANGIET